jgi:hypothetical protein
VISLNTGATGCTKPRLRQLIDLGAIGCGCMEWIDLAKDRDQWRAFVKTVMN